MEIYFDTESIDFKLSAVILTRKWIKETVKNENEKWKVGELSFVFCDDTYLHKMNVEYLSHDTLTDIITFDNSDEENKIEGDIFISVERVRENAVTLKTVFEQELRRVIIHGVLHLCGYKDKTKKDAQIMREKEDFYIAKWLEMA